MTDSAPLRGQRVVILVEQDYDHVDVETTRTALGQAGATVHLVGPIQGHAYRSRDGRSVVADHAASAVRAADIDAVVIPGGFAPDRIRLRHAMVDLVRDAVAAGKPVAAIDHGPSVFINARVLAGRQLTCWPSIAVDAKNAGARYVDRPVVEDGNVITSRKSDDLPFFTDALIRQLIARRA
ncbi:MAG: DJ-1/PfpI family protein [Vicinamibacterales bacterium]